jgi:hypothetical protein
VDVYKEKKVSMLRLIKSYPISSLIVGVLDKRKETANQFRISKVITELSLLFHELPHSTGMKSIFIILCSRNKYPYKIKVLQKRFWLKVAHTKLLFLCS